ncbi:2-hydroxyacid dehydrogenase [Delftia tsuruhatensis]|uniref:2-hydroxyacid dehydrogenase n=1 Tax=Delftia tsuruhatensis TaxID=180282 RepID=UPI0020917076|nr:2-hydroxyacid dehydrogenase [Delftia tsuruhatensis]MCO5335362.1 2-hydroxyacid dehydrogenase [Delftia tsuruhatensis]MCR4546308.1 2-hydroxyacid dehydrogenase [Delftia tsuruhatensis]MDH0772242.1 2-hydroxyacid dehydrogenase [Delftia tsuruhatensis]MDH1456238.1 2-hydroxyacid dehydrogenase [Delftia tsuruhatensis]MDH1825132.1 2-hydroxyacid dehydrogenase [Delftia tsuruhatensis]
MQPALLVLNFNTEAHLRQMAQAFPSFDLLYAPDAAQCEAAIAEHGTRIQAVLTIGSIGLSVAQMQRMPALRLVCALGAGYENIDVAHAQAHGIAVGNGAGTNDDCVADHAMGLLIASVRGLVRLDRATRDGVWRTAMPLPPNVSHKRLGILGMGTIGAKIAQRALGFEMEIGYHNRSPRSGLPHRYFGDLLSLAQWADVLLVATPGGPGTRHLVNAQVLDALGPQGHLVNIARGSVVDTAALAAAVREGRLAGAGLDVYESEPAPPAELLDLDAVVLTPHVGGWSPEAVQASVDRFIANMRCHLEGRPLVSPVTA